jgi:hypothetical protein
MSHSKRGSTRRPTLLRYVAAEPPVLYGSRRHHHPSSGIRPQHHAEDRAGEPAVPL